MLHASSVYREIQESSKFGIVAPEVSVDYAGILAYKEETTEKLVQGVEQLLKANGVSLITGKGTLLLDGKVRVVNEEEEMIAHGKNILLAAGSKPLRLPLPGMDLPGVLTSDELFQLKELPKSLVIIGGGVISVEFATAFAALGTKVTIVEAMPKLIPNMDKELSQSMKLALKKRGVEVHTGAAVRGVVQEGDDYICQFTEKEQEMTAAAQYILCAVGRCPNTDGLFGEGAEPDMERGRVVVDENFRTSLEGVYAIGDLIKGMQLAHTASAQGICVAEQLAGKERTVDLNVVPSCIYTDPEIASAGLTEEAAKEQGLDVEVGKFVMSANGKSLITREDRGFIKIVAEKDTQVIVGAQLMCARATDMIGEFVTAISNHMTVPQLLQGMRAHPTYNEGIGEALEELAGGAIHAAPKRKRS
jgi:dihydrolipoamide dehydrogenase